MPPYEFRCRSCGGMHRRMLPTVCTEDISCPWCEGRGVDRLPSSPVAMGDANTKGGSTVKLTILECDFLHSITGTTCCGRRERCSIPPCFAWGFCQRRQGDWDTIKLDVSMGEITLG